MPGARGMSRNWSATLISLNVCAVIKHTYFQDTLLLTSGLYRYIVHARLKRLAKISNESLLLTLVSDSPLEAYDSHHLNAQASADFQARRVSRRFQIRTG
jgi:hypothetical protein